MKKVYILVIIVAIIGTIGCEKKSNIWDCSVVVNEDSDKYSFSDEIICSGGGQLSINNQSNNDVDFCLVYADDLPLEDIKFEGSIPAGGCFVQCQIEENINYKLGIRAYTKSKTKIRITVTEKDAKLIE